MKVFGYISTVIIFIGAVFFGLAYVEFKKYKSEIVELIPALITEISKSEQYSSLGDYSDCPTNGAGDVEIQVSEPVKAEVEMACVFENGKADIYVKLHRTNNEWEIAKVRVTSDAFVSSFKSGS